MAGRLPPGPYRTLSGPLGDVPWYMLSFDRQGRCSSPRTAAEVVERAGGGEVTDVVAFSHGWNNDWIEATERYDSFVTGYLRQSARIPVGEPRRVLLLGVFWPSKSLVGAAGRGPEIAAGGGGGVAVAEERDDVAELGSMLDGERAERFYALLQRDSLTAAEAAELAGMFLPLLASDAAETAEPVPDDPAQFAATWATAATPASEVADLDELGLFDDDDDSDGAADPEAAGGLSLDPRGIVWALTVWKMKDRAGAVGVHGIAPLLTALQRTDVRVHCIGHSYGAKVMLSAICAAGMDRPVRSALLLQPAVSHLCFADAVPGSGRPGGYRTALDRIELPVLSTFSDHDGPLTGPYHWALRRARDVGEPDVAAAGDPPSRYAALGGYGPRGLGARSRLIDVLDAGENYPLGPGAPDVYGVRSTRTISSHGAVSISSTWWMLQQLLRAGD